MIAKVIVRGADREDAIGRMLRALGEFEVGGIKTLVGFHRALLSHPCFRAGETCEGIVESQELAEAAEQLSRLSHLTTSLGIASDGASSTELATEAEIDGRRVRVSLRVPEPGYRALARRRRERAAASAGGAGAGIVVSPMQGTVIAVKVQVGDTVRPGEVVCIVEAMKMENEVASAGAGVVSDVAVAAGDPVAIGQTILVIEPGSDG